MRTAYLVLIIFLVLMSPVIAQSGLDQGLNKPTIALLGTFHFAGSSDVMSLKIDDLSSPKRQNEIKELTQALTQYKPTKIILQFPYGNNKLDSIYQLYLNKTHTLTINERQQVGFRVAAKMGHKNVYPADHHLDLPFDSLMAYLEENKQMGQFQDLMSHMKIEVIDVWQKAYDDSSLKEFFVFLNADIYDAMNRNI